MSITNYVGLLIRIAIGFVCTIQHTLLDVDTRQKPSACSAGTAPWAVARSWTFQLDVTGFSQPVCPTGSQSEAEEGSESPHAPVSGISEPVTPYRLLLVRI